MDRSAEREGIVVMRTVLLEAADSVVKRRADAFNKLLSPCTTETVNRVCVEYLWRSAQLRVIRHLLRCLP
jgi:hypothetical protein